MGFDIDAVDCWIFDLDNTLYPPSTRLFDQIDVRMGEYIAQLLGCDAIEARRIQKLYFHDHGTTLAGLMHNHDIDPYDFLGFVHAIDFAPLSAAPRLADTIARLPGRKLVCTNGDAEYAGHVLAALGLEHSFEGLWDVHAMHYRPKPEPSANSGMIEAFGIEPTGAVFVEDMARNLTVPKALGMQTVWIDLGTDWGDRAKDDAAIDVVIDDLAQWLGKLVEPAATS